MKCGYKSMGLAGSLLFVGNLNPMFYSLASLTIQMINTNHRSNQTQIFSNRLFSFIQFTPYIKFVIN